ncbi:MAG: Kelch repeat-containing protein [Planctomycetota bacterium]
MSLRRCLPLALCAAHLTAQSDFDLEKRSGGRLGDPLVLEAVGAPPLSVLLLVPSNTAGPTPLSLVDPTDPRAVSVGIDLVSVTVPMFPGVSGAATASLSTPVNLALHGAVLNWQALELTFGASVFGELSNPVVTQTGLADAGVLAPAGLSAARSFAATLVDADNNASGGDVLVTGGGSGTLTSATGLASTELWDFRTMSFSAGPNMASARVLHSAVRMNDGRVLIVGGADQNATTLSSCEIYDPAVDQFFPTGSMATPRVLHGACLMADGRVMVAGGTDTLSANITDVVTGTLNSAEIYDPATGVWSSTSNIGGRRLAPALTRLPNGEVMVSGGVEISFFFGFPVSASSTNKVQRWSNGGWSNGPNMAQGRSGHQYNQVRLNDGRILMTGGIDVPSLLGATNAAPISGAEVFNPANGTWQTVNMPIARALHSATLLGDGRVAVCGGAQGLLTAPASISAVHVFQPSTNSWSSAPPLTGPRASHVARLLPDGTLALFGGQGASATLTSVETLRF